MDVDGAHTIPVICAPELHFAIISTCHHKAAMICYFMLRELGITYRTEMSRDCVDATMFT